MNARRCNATERAVFRAYECPSAYSRKGVEPALGTLAERLEIICRRTGAPKAVRLSKAERAEWARYLMPLADAA